MVQRRIRHLDLFRESHLFPVIPTRFVITPRQPGTEQIEIKKCFTFAIRESANVDRIGGLRIRHKNLLYLDLFCSIKIR